MDMNLFEKRMKQIERKIPHYSYKVELIPKNSFITQKFGFFEPFQNPKPSIHGFMLKGYILDGKRVVKKSEYKNIPYEELLKDRRTENWSTQYVVYYYDKNETEEERKKAALEFGRKEFERRLGLLVGLEEHQYGNGWELLVYDAIEHEHYERLTQISLEEFLNEA